jgi:hypothetical protein
MNYRFTNDGRSYYTREVMGYDGNPVKRAKAEYPYSYDPFLVWAKEEKYIKNAQNGVYSDRLWEWDYKKYNKCCKEVWNNEGQYFSNRSPESIEKFLQLYNNNLKLELVKIAEGCNVGNGYSYWIFWYNDNK